MFIPYKIGIFGGDARYVYLTKDFLKMNSIVNTYNTEATVDHPNCFGASSLADLFKKSDILIGPIPMTRDHVHITSQNTRVDMTIDNIIDYIEDHHCLIGGNIPKSLEALCLSQGIPYFDLMHKETITILNAIATAEGAIMEAILNSSCNLHRNNCLVLGYGRCGKILAQKLKGLDANVTIAARSETALAYATAYGFPVISLDDMKEHLSSYQFIFNTIPALVIDRACLNLIDQSCLIIDIASAPGGVDFTYAKECNINAKLCLGLPGKVAPMASADIIFNEVNVFLKERSD